ncbi:phage tail tube protein [Comamonas kerstersii]|uniref:Phage tail protein n=1 Tax=Comamonas kerstersii TaxID=225992 RepID=A0A6A1R1A3_9BURK|nr:phage tail tube protein [Comamonas kerstersii]KAB0586183.1 phage tail protein [Comamonas kerstersii]
MPSLPTGARHSLCTVFAEEVAVTAISNATEAVCTAPGHDLAAGDIVLIESGWSRLNNRSFRVKSVDADTFTLEGKKANTSNTEFYIPGGGAGSVKKAITWVDIDQVLSTSTSGGEAKKVTYRYENDENEYEINDGWTPVSRTMEIDSDAIDTPGYNALLDLTEVQTTTIMRTINRNGSITLLPCTVALNEEEIRQEGQINRVRVDVSGKARSIRYKS